jgi:hypothetical protein
LGNNFIADWLEDVALSCGTYANINSATQKNIGKTASPHAIPLREKISGWQRIQHLFLDVL